MLDQLGGVGAVAGPSEREHADGVGVSVDLDVSDPAADGEHQPDDVGWGGDPAVGGFGGGAREQRRCLTRAAIDMGIFFLPYEATFLTDGGPQPRKYPVITRKYILLVLHNMFLVLRGTYSTK